jgi:adenosylhomocysteine nucleosidase
LIGLVTGLTIEADVIAKVAARLGVPRTHQVRCDGMGPERASAAARALAGQGATLLVSFGCCGGLVPAARPGDLVLATAAVQDCGPRWPTQTLERLSGLTAHRAPIAATAHVVATPEDKAALAARTGAIAVDMESSAIAQAAQTAGLPFIVLRVVIDPVEQGLPPELLGAVSWDGGIDMAQHAQTLRMHPHLKPEARRLRAASRRCLASLRAAATALLKD